MIFFLNMILEKVLFGKQKFFQNILMPFKKVPVRKVFYKEVFPKNFFLQKQVFAIIFYFKECFLAKTFRKNTLS